MNKKISLPHLGKYYIPIKYIIEKITKCEMIIPEENNNQEANEAHGMKRSEWKSLDKNIRRKLKKYGFSKSSEVNPAFIAYITKKVEKKKLKKGTRNTL